MQTKTINFNSIIIFLVSIFCNTLNAQINIGKYAFNDNVNAILKTSDGSTYVGGQFTAVGLYSGSGVILDADSVNWDSTDVRIEGTVFCSISIPKQLGGGWYIGGGFNQINGQPRIGLARINQDGTLHSFNPTTDNVVYALELDTSGNLYVGGDFNLIGGASIRNYLAKFDKNGMLTTFNPNMDRAVHTLKLDKFGNLYVGGQFTTIGGSNGRRRLAKFDASGNLTNFAPDMNNTVFDIVLDTNNNLYVGGSFTFINGLTNRNYLAKFNNLGVLTNYNPNFNATVFALAIDLTGNIYAGGSFTTVGGSTTRNYLAKFNNSGTLTSFNPNMNQIVNVLTIDSNGYLYAGGAFTRVGSITRNHIAKFDNSGTLTSFHPNLNEYVWTLELNESGSLFAGGQFTILGGLITRNRIAKFDNVGNLTAFNPNLNGNVFALALDSSENLYIGGDFSMLAGTINRRSLAKFDSTGTLSSFNPNINTTVFALTLDAKGNLYVGGDFSSVANGSITRNRLAKYSKTGNLTSFNPNFNQVVYALTTDVNGNLFVGGSFTTVGGSTTRNRLAKFDSTGNLTNFNPNLNNNVRAFVIDNNDNLYVGGLFSSIGGSITRNRLAKFDKTGNLSSFNPNLNSNVYALCVDENDNLYAGGQFNNVGGSTVRNRIAKFDNTGVLTNFNPNMNNIVWALALDNDGNLNSGGSFFSKFAYYCFSPPTIKSVKNGKICSFGEVKLEAKASVGRVYWYTDSIGGIPIHSGTKFTTPYISKTTTYFVEADNGGCKRDIRYAVVATIDTISRLAPQGNLNQSFCGNSTVADLYAVGDLIKWYDSASFGNVLSTNHLLRSKTNYFASQTLNGCESKERLKVIVTINNYSNSIDTQIACNSYKWIDGNTYTSSNDSATYKIVGGAANGCDSIVKLNLIILNSSTGNDIQTACNSYKWIDGIIYTSSNDSATYHLIGAAANGCDSVVKLNLTILSSKTGIDKIVECDSFTWIDGKTYTSNNDSVTYNIIGGSANGCDSLVTLELTILKSSIGTDNQTACNSYTWIDGKIYTSSNNSAQYNINGGAANGCDSIVILNLTINNVSDITTSTSGSNITANNNIATYQWLDCNNNFAKISGASNQIFSPTLNGSYAVELTENSCVDTSSCVVFSNLNIVENDLGFELVFYPNPTNGKLIIELGKELINVHLTVRNLLGQEIYYKNYASANQIELNLESPSGIYLIEILSNGKKAVLKIIKE